MRREISDAEISLTIGLHCSTDSPIKPAATPALRSAKKTSCSSSNDLLNLTSRKGLPCQSQTR